MIVYRNADIRKYQIFAYPEWPGGLFASPSMAGTRPGVYFLIITLCSYLHHAAICCKYVSSFVGSQKKGDPINIQSLYVGGNIASSWAVLQCMGQDGYMEVAKKLMEVATRMKEGIQSTEVIKSPPPHSLN